MYIYIKHTYMYLRVYAYIYTHPYIYTCEHIHTCFYTHVCIYTTCIHLCIPYAFTPVTVCACIFIHI